MGQMQNQLQRILSDHGDVTIGNVPYPRYADVAASKYADEVMRVYRSLGGVLEQFPLNLRSWDLEFNGVAVELDEYLHFNRYRRATLESAVYQELPRFPLEAYRRYCDDYEERCLKAGSYGGKWSNPSCERQFGPAGAQKDLSGNGAARWRQRAFYDFVKDLSPLIIDVPVVRLSIWESIGPQGQQRTVGANLEDPSASAIDTTLRLITTRAS